MLLPLSRKLMTRRMALSMAPLPKGTHELTFQLQHPFSFNWTSGGFFVDWHCHNVDVACWAGKKHDWFRYESAPNMAQRLAWYTFLAEP